jgi:hypothetical protein
VVLQPDGKIVVGGFVQRSGYRSSPAEAALLRLDPNGAPDRTFGAGSQVLASRPGINNVTAMGLDTSGDIFVLPAHAEFSPTGQLDSTTRPSAITAASQGHNDVFLANGQYVHTASVGVVKHDVDVQAQRFNADGSVASTSATFDYSGAVLQFSPTAKPSSGARSSSGPTCSAWHG